MGADPVAPQPAGFRQFQRTRQPAIIGEQQQALGVEVEPADRDQPRQAFRQIVEYRRPSFGVGMGRHQPARLVIQKQPGALARRQRLAIDGDGVVGGDVERRGVDDAAIDADAALHDPFLGVAARGQPRPRQHFRDPVAGLLLAWRPRGAFLEVGLALAIGAAAAERGTLGEDLAVVLVVAARPVAIAARMLLPGAACFSGTIEFGTVLARPRKARALVAAALLTRSIDTRLVITALFEISSAVARWTRVAADMIG